MDGYFVYYITNIPSFVSDQFIKRCGLLEEAKELCFDYGMKKRGRLGIEHYEDGKFIRGWIYNYKCDMSEKDWRTLLGY